MKIHHDIEQNGVDWLILRSGKITASEADNLVSPTGKVRDGAGVKTYLSKKLTEKWTGGPLPSLHGAFDCEQGQILEERARPAFTIHTGLEAQTVGFIETDDGLCGCSPDAIIGETAGCEIKCPQIATQISYLLAGKLPAEYIAQVQFSLWVTGFSTWHFFSYNRRLPPLHLVVARDDNFQRALAIAIGDFLAALDAGMKQLVELNGGPPKLPTPSLTRPDDSTSISDDDFTP